MLSGTDSFKIQVEQVLANRVLKSLNAINGSGNTTGNTIVQIRLLPDETIETTVTDSGPGIDTDMLWLTEYLIHTRRTSLQVCEWG